MKNFAYTLFLFTLFLSCQSNSIIDTLPELQTEEVSFVHEPESLHYYLIALKKIETPDKASLDEMKNLLSDFIQNHFEEDKLRISNIYLSEGENSVRPVLIVRRFSGKAIASNFHQELLKTHPKKFKNKKKIRSFPISQTNYRNVLRQKNLEGYFSFVGNN